MSVRPLSSQFSTVERSPAFRFSRGRLLPALLAILALFFALSARGDEAVAVRAGLHDGFGRLVLEWPAPVAVTGRQEGGRYRLRFGRPFGADLDAAVRHLGNYLASATPGPEGRELVLELAPNVAVRQHVQKGRIVVLDLAPAAPGAPSDEVEVRAGLHDGFGRLVFDWPVPVAFDALTAGRHIGIRFDRAGDIDVGNVTARLGAWLEAASASRSDDRSVVRLALQAGATARVFRVDEYRVVVDLSAAPARARIASPRTAPVPSAQARAAVGPRPAARAPAQSAIPPVPAPAPEPAASAPAPEPEAASAAAPGPGTAPAGDAASAHLTIASGTDDEGAYVDFAWTRPVPAAVFLRAGHLWVVFAAETSRPEDLVVPPMVPALRDDLGPGERVEASGGTALRFPLRRPLAAEVIRLDRMWRVRLKGDAQAPQAVHPRRLASPPRLRLAPGEGPRLITLRDPEVGDELTVWPLLQANVGQPRQRLVDLELPATVQGLAWRLRRDGVEARLLADAVEFVASGGLILSEQAAGEAPPSELGAAPPHETSGASATSLARTALQQPDEAMPEPPPPERTDEAAVAPPLGLVGWELGPAYTAPQRRAEPLGTAEQDGPDERDGHRLDLARRYLSKAMAAEALGVLGTIERPEDAATRQARQALRGAAELLMGRIDDAAATLGAPLYDDDPEVALWRAAIAAAREDWPEAVRQLERSEEMLATYPQPLRLRLGLAAARAAIETEDGALATTLLEQLEDAELAPGERARLAFLSALAQARNGATGAADEIWRALEHTGPVDVRVDAAFARTELLLDAGELDPVAAIARLAPTRGLWRGHPREATMLAALADMYADAGDRPNALRTWRELLDRHAGTPGAPALVQRMRATLIETLLAEGDAALSPVQTYALSREFGALIPDEPPGDRVRRRIAHHLAELDLIHPAAALLGTVVDRLTGVDKAAAGADLAELRLRLGEPEPALAALEHSEFGADLPAALIERRRILRADALARLERPFAALALLDDLEAPAADDLRLEILWRQQDWPRLIAAIGDALDRRKDAGAGLGERERAMLLRLAIAHGRLGEGAALARLRARFAAAFHGQALEPAFLLATASREPTDQPEAILAAAERHLRRVRGYLEAEGVSD